MDQKNPLTLFVALAIIAAALGGALYMMHRADARVKSLDAEEGTAVIPVETLVVEPVDLPRFLEARGFLRGIEEVTVHSEVLGRVISRSVADGDHVDAGHILLTVDDTFHALNVQRAEAELRRSQGQFAEARAAVKQMEAQLESARAVRANRANEFERIESLHSSGNAPQIEYDRIATAFQTAEADLAAAEAALNRTIDQREIAEAAVGIAEAAVGEARAHLERCVVRAPLPGSVNQVFIEPGEYAVAGAPVAEIIRLDRLKMVIELADTDLALLESFTHAEFRADATGGGLHEAQFHHVAPKMDPVSKKFRVELRVENDDGALLSGMYGKAILHCGRLEDVLSIPRKAVFKHFGADFCLVARVDAEGVLRAKLQRVDVRDIQGRLDDVEVLAGLEPGDHVIVSQRRELHDGVAVKPAGAAEIDGVAASVH